MMPVTTPEQIAAAIQQVKAAAPNFCTNFFPAQSRLKAWIDRRELVFELHPKCGFFLRRDRDFHHLYFSASDPDSLEGTLPKLDRLDSRAITADLIGSEASLQGLLKAFSTAGFRPYSRLLRLSRGSQPGDPASSSREELSENRVTLADPSDASAVLTLIESSFDRYADQLPALYEVEHAITERQIFVVKRGSDIAALLFFETQGLTSTVRYWVVGDRFRSHGYGSMLMRHYWLSQANARRFVLWVRAANDDALSKYRHYSYAPDGLVDHVMANGMIR